MRDWRIRIVRTEIGIVGLVAVGAPVPLVLTRIGVEYNHAPVAVPVRDIRFIGGGVDSHFGGHVDVLNVVAVLWLIWTTDLQQEFASPRELQDLGRAFAVARNPDVILVVEADAVRRVEPVVTRPGPAPVTK